jgi:hypothetical protein
MDLLHDLKILQKLGNHAQYAACSLDSIPTKILKDVLPEIAKPITNILNSCLKDTHVPNYMKNGIVTCTTAKLCLQNNIKIVSYRVKVHLES